MLKSSIQINLPTWLSGFNAEKSGVYATPEARMQLVVMLSRLNIEQGTGGPFGAAVFDRQTHQLLATGVNLVTSSDCSLAHAEMVALASAQQQFGSFDLGAKGLPECELVSSCEPCAMCFGAIPWSGVRHVICGARDSDARAIGFDEGPRHPDWQQQLLVRGIGVECDVCRDDAASVLRTYADQGGLIYNGREA